MDKAGRKQQRKVTAAFIMLLGAFFLCAGSCKAWQPPKKEDEAAFLRWYEENKHTDGAYYRLTGDLYLTGGENEDPICLDGQGKLTIDCGGYGILADTDVTIDNPEITIWGESIFLIMVRSGAVLTLNRGTIEFSGQGGSAIHVANGRLQTPSDKGRVMISANGRDVTGIFYNHPQEKMLSNLNISVEGSEIAKGVDAPYNTQMTVDGCDIEVTGGTEAYGIYGRDAMDVLVRNSRISAAVTNADGIKYSVCSPGGHIQCEHSVTEPEAVPKRIYQIMETKAREPVYVEAGDQPKNWQLPTAMDTYAWVMGGEEEELINIPVAWNVPEESFTEPGYCTVTGNFVTEPIDGDVLNPDEVVPEITVLCLPPEKMFPIAYETYEDPDREGATLLVPYPYGAQRLMVEYSMDGQTFQRYMFLGDANMLTQGETVRKDGMYSFYIHIPVTKEGLYIRTVVEGDSLFAGTSAVWKLIRKDEGLPENTGGDSSGDRGGQSPNQPGQDRSASRETEYLTADEASEKQSSGKKPGKGSKEASKGTSESENASTKNDGAAKENANHTSADGQSHTSAAALGQNAQKKEEKAQEEHKSRWPGIIAAMAGILILAAAGIRCGKKAFFSGPKMYD